MLKYRKSSSNPIVVAKQFKSIRIIHFGIVYNIVLNSIQGDASIKNRFCVNGYKLAELRFP